MVACYSGTIIFFETLVLNTAIAFKKSAKKGTMPSLP
jgi:hypothetical protein